MGFIQADFQDIRDEQLIKRAKIDAASSGDNTLVAAVTGKKIRVLAAFFTMTGTAVTIRFESGAGGTALTGQMGPTAGQTLSTRKRSKGNRKHASNH